MCVFMLRCLRIPHHREKTSEDSSFPHRGISYCAAVKNSFNLSCKFSRASLLAQVFSCKCARASARASFPVKGARCRPDNDQVLGHEPSRGLVSFRLELPTAREKPKTLVSPRWFCLAQNVGMPNPHLPPVRTAARDATNRHKDTRLPLNRIHACL